MHKNRIEAFSDGVLAILMTIMVLELKAPHGGGFSDLEPLLPVFFSYVLSFVYIGIYWNNHHHLFQAVKTINGSVLWANLHLLFWLSLIPFVTAWSGENQFAPGPIVLYGFVLLMCGVAYTILVRSLMAHHSDQSVLKQAIGSDVKGWISIGAYVVAMGFALWIPLVSGALYVGVAILWFIPDRRIEDRLKTKGPE